MEKENLDFVICENTTELFVAPGFSRLEEGDLIEIENSKVYLNVKKVVTINTTYHKDFIDFMITISGKPTLRKVVKKIEETELEYDSTDFELIENLNKKENENGRINNED